MPNIYEFVDPGLDEKGEPLPFSKFNKRMIAINTAFACERMGLTNSRRLTSGYINVVMNPKK